MANPASANVTPKIKPVFRRREVLRLLAIALVAEIGYAVLNVSTMPVYLKMDRAFGPFAISIVLVAFLLSEAVFKGPMGHAADRYGATRLMMAGPAITLGTALLSLAVPWGNPRIGEVWEVAIFCLLRVCDGIGAAMLWPAAFALMSDTVADDERQEAMSLLNMCYLVGIALAFPAGGAAAKFTGSRTAGFYLAAVFFALAAFATWRMVRRESKRTDVSDVGEHEGFQIASFLGSMRAIPAYLILAVVTFMGIGFPMAIIKIFALEEFRMDELQFGALVFPGAIAMAGLAVPMSKYGERVGRARAVHIGMGLCALGLLFISLGAFVPTLRVPWAFALGGIPVGVGFLLSIPAWLTSVSDIDPKKRAANLGAVMTAQGLGAIVGAPLGGLMYQELVPVGQRLGLGASFGHYSPFVGCFVCVALGWALSLRLLRVGSEPAPHTPPIPATTALGLDGPNPPTSEITKSAEA